VRRIANDGIPPFWGRSRFLGEDYPINKSPLVDSLVADPVDAEVRKVSYFQLIRLQSSEWYDGNIGSTLSSLGRMP
jgi:hypothetical protein